MNQSISLQCQRPDHGKGAIIGVCLNYNCKDASVLCIKCVGDHQNHGILSLDDLKKQGQLVMEKHLKNLTICDNIINTANLMKKELMKEKDNYHRLLIMKSFSELNEIVKLLQNQSYVQGIDYSQRLQKIQSEIIDIRCTIELSPYNLNDIQQQEFQEIQKQANTLYSQGKYQEAFQAYDRCLRIDSINHKCQWRKGMCLKLQGKYNEAIQIFDSILSVNQTFVDALCHKADSLRLLCKYDEAILSFDRTLQLDPNNFVALSYKGEALRKLQKYEQSLIFFDKALQINQNSGVTLFGKGDSLRCLQKYDQSLQVLNQGIQIEPNNALLHYSKGMIYHYDEGFTLKSKGLFQEALACFEKCLALNPQYKVSLQKEIDQLKKQIK